MNFAKGQPVCSECYNIYYGGRYVRMVPPKPELCSHCGFQRTHIYYLRLNPLSVKYPKVYKPKRRKVKTLVHHK